MSAENRKHTEILTAMLGIVLSDPESILFGWSLATVDNNSELAEFLKEKGNILGIKEEEFENALNAMKATNEFLGKIE